MWKGKEISILNLSAVIWIQWFAVLQETATITDPPYTIHGSIVQSIIKLL